MSSRTINIFILLVFFAISCNKSSDLIQHCYYSFENSQDPALANFIQECLAWYQQHDYIITTQEQLLAIPRDSSIDISVLHPLHKKIHRIDPFNKHKRYKENDIHIHIDFIKNKQGHYELGFQRYIYTEDNNWKLEFAYPRHLLAGTHNKNFQKQMYAIRKEFARTSYK